MNTENWPQIKEILQLAIEQPPSLRTRYLEEKCSGDAVLLRKVESLINSYERVGDFMEDGAIGGVADMFASSKNGLGPGDSIGRYQIVRVLGEGGMGMVYLADDPDLHRQVAVKVLRDDLWWYKQARQRLLREARAAARLDHPNICSIYEIVDSDERSFIVMQYIEGRTLSDVMAQGGLGGNQCMSVALQIADALAEAHTNHIIHRDIKPANIIINEKGHAKVLDFGLAKSIEPQSEKPENEISSSGAVMGTVPYMSPEQLKGKSIDGRSDIFSLGALLFEMVSGHQAFGRENNAETIAAILNEEPDLSVVPRKFRFVIQKSLKKKAADRYQSIADLSRDLRDVAEDPLASSVPAHSFTNWFGAKSVISTAFRRYLSDRTAKASTGRGFYKWQDSDSDARTVPLTARIPSEPITERHPVPFSLRPYLLGGLGVFVLALIPTLYWFTRPQSDPHAFDSLRPVKIAEWKDAGSNIYLGYSSSHDSKLIAYSSKQEGPSEGIYVKPIAGGNEVRVTKDEWNNSSPIWSPDDQRLAFISYRNGSRGIYTVPFSGGETTLIRSVDRGPMSLRHWSKDGSTIYYEFKGNLFSLDLTSRQSKQITSFKPIESPNRDFSFSPNEDKVVYCDKINGQTDLWIAPVKGGEATQLTDDPEVENCPFWHPDGNRILYSVTRDRHDQINVAYLIRRAPDQITRGEGDYQLIDVSADGSKIFYTTWEDHSDVWGISVESGQEFQVAATGEAEFWSDVSPDGRSILYQTNPDSDPIPHQDESKIVIRSTGNAGNSKVFSGYDPRWLSDRKSIAFLRPQESKKGYAIWKADTITDEEIQVVDEWVVSPRRATLPYNRLDGREFSWSSDDSEVAYVANIAGASNIHRKSLNMSTAIAVSQNSDPSVTFYSPLFSLEGRRIAYISVEMGAGDGAKAITRVWLDEDGQSKEIYSTTDGLKLLGWSGDSNLMVAAVDGPLGAPADARLLSLTVGGSPHLIAAIKGVYAPSAALSPDRKTVTFTVRQNDRDDIFTIQSTGGIAKKISSNNDPRSYYGSLAWSPDGKTIYFDKQERMNTVSMLENFR